MTSVVAMTLGKPRAGHFFPCACSRNVGMRSSTSVVRRCLPSIGGGDADA